MDAYEILKFLSIMVVVNFWINILHTQKNQAELH